MYLGEFLNCCGIKIIYNFGHTRVNGQDFNASYRPTVEEVQAYLLEREGIYKRYGMLMATINQQQKDAIGLAFRRAKWKLISKCNHPGHGNNIYVYAKVLNEAKL